MKVVSFSREYFVPFTPKPAIALMDAAIPY